MRPATLITSLRGKAVAILTATMLVGGGSMAMMPAAVSAEDGAPALMAAGDQTIAGYVTGLGQGQLQAIEVYKEQADHSWKIVRSFESYNNGYYGTPPLEAGDYRIHVDGGYRFKSEFYNDVQTDDITDPAIETITLDGTSGAITGKDFDLEPHEAFTVSGTVTWGAEAPQRFRVIARRAGETEVVAAASSKNSSEYSIDLRPGAYTLTFSDGTDPYEDKSFDVTVVDADIVAGNLDIPKPPDLPSQATGTITGTLRDNGFPANGGNVLLFQYRPDDGAWMQMEGAVADDDGRFVFDKVQVGEKYTLEAKRTGFGNQYLYYGGETREPDSATNLNSFTVRKGQTFDAGEMDFTASGVPFTSAPTPAIHGTAAVDSTLTATTVPTLWDPTYPSLRYRWLRNGAPISNATAAKYVPSASDLGTNISVMVTATAPTAGADYLPAKVYSAETGPVALGTLTQTPLPTINGTAAVAKTVSVSTGAWTPGTTLTYQWYRDSSAIPGATSTAYSLVASDRGKRFTVRVTGSKNGYTPVSTTSSSTKPAAAGKFTAPTPKIKGKAKVGKTLRAIPGAWAPSGTKLKYQWLANGKKIAKATKAKYKVSPKVRGKKITVKVTGSRSGYQTLTKKSKATKAT